jgi:outer membrane protein assembly factor BamB
LWLAGGTVYIGGRSGKVYALRTTDGKEIWRSSSGASGSLASSIATDKDAAYVSNDYGEIRALRTRDGTEIWRLATGGSMSGVITTRNIVYVSSNNLYAVRAADGKQLWSFPAEVGGLTTAPGVVYFNTGSSVYALRA